MNQSCLIVRVCFNRFADYALLNSLKSLARVRYIRHFAPWNLLGLIVKLTVIPSAISYTLIDHCFKDNRIMRNKLRKTIILLIKYHKLCTDIKNYIFFYTFNKFLNQILYVSNTINTLYVENCSLHNILGIKSCFTF